MCDQAVEVQCQNLHPLPSPSVPGTRLLYQDFLQHHPIWIFEVRAVGPGGFGPAASIDFSIGAHPLLSGTMQAGRNTSANCTGFAATNHCKTIGSLDNRNFTVGHTRLGYRINNIVYEGSDGVADKGAIMFQRDGSTHRPDFQLPALSTGEQYILVINGKKYFLSYSGATHSDGAVYTIEGLEANFTDGH